MDICPNYYHNRYYYDIYKDSHCLNAVEISSSVPQPIHIFITVTHIFIMCMFIYIVSERIGGVILSLCRRQPVPLRSREDDTMRIVLRFQYDYVYDSDDISEFMNRIVLEPDEQESPRVDRTEQIVYCTEHTLRSGKANNIIDPSSDIYDEQCSICFDGLKGRKHCTVRTCCGHHYHLKCCKDLYQAQWNLTRCPICRHERPQYVRTYFR